MFLKKLKLILFILKINKTDYLDVHLTQRQKGLKKYGRTLQNCPCDRHDWSRMVLEEVVDAFEYLDKKDSCNDRSKS